MSKKIPLWSFVLWIENESLQECHVMLMKNSGFSDLLICTIAFNLFTPQQCLWSAKYNQLTAAKVKDAIDSTHETHS